MITFAWGSFTEAYAIYLALPQLSGVFRYLGMLQILVNILGCLGFYPEIIKKGIKAIKGDTGDKKKNIPSKQLGVLFPEDAKGVRSTTSAGRSLLAAAMRGASNDAAEKAAAKCEKEKDWRFSYTRHFLKLVELGCESSESALGQAKAGLAWAHHNFQFQASPSATPVRLEAIVDGQSKAGTPLKSFRISGPAAGAQAPARMPFNGAFKRGNTRAPGPGDVVEGSALKEQLQRWASSHVIEPDAAVRACAAVDYFGDGGTLKGHHFIVIGVTSAMGPAEHLLALGAHVIGISRGGSRESKQAWDRLFALAAATPGAVLEAPCTSDAKEDVGADLLAQPGEIRDWLLDVVSKLPAQDKVIIGNYTYLDSDLHVKITLAADVLIASLMAVRSTAGVAFLGTPTDATLIPAEAHRASRDAWEQGMLTATGPFEALVRLLTCGKRLRPNAREPLKTPNKKPFYLMDGYSVAQGPNYALAKRLQHWRAMVAFSEGRVASTRVAPSTATTSVMHNRTFGWAYLGMPFFTPLEVFKQETTAALMTLLLVADVLGSGSAKDPRTSGGLENPLQLFSSESAHGGVWRCPYKLDTVGEVCVLAHFAGGPATFKSLAAVLGWLAPAVLVGLVVRLAS
jgi:hypothetical protein